MATFWSTRGAERGPSFRGRVIFDTYQGKVRARAWPRHKTRRRDKRHREQMEWFAEANWIDRWAPAIDKIVRRQATQGTVWMPRDPLLKQLRGQLLEPILSDGTVYRSMSIRRQVSEALDYITDKPGEIAVRRENGWEREPLPQIPSAQTHLDQISNQDGTILARQGGTWIAVPPGADGQVLVWDKSQGRPVWKDADLSGGDGSGGGSGDIETASPSPKDLPFKFLADHITKTTDANGLLHLTWPANTAEQKVAGWLRKAGSTTWTGHCAIEAPLYKMKAAILFYDTNAGRGIAAWYDWSDYINAYLYEFDSQGSLTNELRSWGTNHPDTMYAGIEVGQSDIKVHWEGTPGNWHNTTTFNITDLGFTPNAIGAGFRSFGVPSEDVVRAVPKLKLSTS